VIALLSLLLCGQVAPPGDGYIVPGVDAERVTMTVNVWGEVRNPGVHQIPWNADLVAALSAAGGPTGQADLRDVRIVYRDFQSEYDLRAYLDGEGSTVPAMERLLMRWIWLFRTASISNHRAPGMSSVRDILFSRL